MEAGGRVTLSLSGGHAPASLVRCCGVDVSRFYFSNAISQFQPKQITSLPSRVHSYFHPYIGSALVCPYSSGSYALLTLQEIDPPNLSTKKIKKTSPAQVFIWVEKSPVARHILFFFSQYFKKKHPVLVISFCLRTERVRSPG